MYSLSQTQLSDLCLILKQYLTIRLQQLKYRFDIYHTSTVSWKCMLLFWMHLGYEIHSENKKCFKCLNNQAKTNMSTSEGWHFICLFWKKYLYIYMYMKNIYTVIPICAINKSALILLMVWCLTDTKPLPKLTRMTITAVSLPQMQYDVKSCTC